MSDRVRPWILISQSARVGRGKALRDAIREALVAQQNNDGPRYRVLLDETDLNPGEFWRPTNEEWLWRSEGVVLMLNNAALRDESYVVYEVMRLWLRSRQFPDHFRFLIVRFPDVGDDLLERRFKALQLSEIQQIKLSDAFRDDADQTMSESVEHEIQTVTAEIVSAMQRLGATGSCDWIEEHLVDTLNNQTRELNQLYTLLERLAVVPEATDGGKLEVSRWIIRKLLDRNGTIGPERLDQLQVAVDQLVTVFSSMKHVQRLINYIVPYCWVHPEAAARLYRIAYQNDGLRAVAWRRNWDLSEKMYLWRAWGKPLSRIVAVHVKSGDLDDCKAKVFEALALTFNRDPALTAVTTVQTSIQRSVMKGEPVCVVLAAIQTGREIMSALTQEWPEVLFFFFERETDAVRLAPWELTGIEWLTPAVDLSLEAHAMDGWSDLMIRAGVERSDITTGKAFEV